MQYVVQIYIPRGYENNKYQHCKDACVIWHLTFRKVIKETTVSQTFGMRRRCALGNYFQVLRKLFNRKAVDQVEVNDCFRNTFQMTIYFVQFPICRFNKLNLISTCVIILPIVLKCASCHGHLSAAINHLPGCFLSALISPFVKSE